MRLGITGANAGGEFGDEPVTWTLLVNVGDFFDLGHLYV